MRYAKLLILAVLALTSIGAAELSATNVGFVDASGTHFELDGQPYYYVGASYYNAMNLGAEVSTRNDLDAAFAGLQALGIRNVRIWASSEGAGGADQLTPTLQPTAGSYSETMFQGLDYALKSANDHNLRCVMVLNNSWDWSGGMNQYVDWSPTTDKTKTNWSWGQGAYHDQFYTDNNCQETYQAFIDTIVNRSNTQNGGLAYKDDPTIFSWELANEPRAHIAGETVLSNWIDATAAYIKSLDSNHMVTTGSEGFLNTGGTQWWEDGSTGVNFVADHLSDNIDYTTVHIWPFNWSWYPEASGDIDNMAEMYDRCTTFLAEHLTSAQNDLGKPLVLEEFGLLRDDDHDGDGSEPPGSPTTERDTLFERYYDMLYASAAAGGPGAGSNFWTYSGDPPQEDNGLNSVWDPDDVSTLLVISDAAADMNSIPEPGTLVLALTAVFGLSACRRARRS
ncbi:MAG TPA: hypothetical protein VMZ92_04900 [Planctomycetota bacterium]|nr:hypothetical protein [Planctomycetota bacterium]